MKIFIRIILSILTLIIVILGVVTTIFVINKKNNTVTNIFGYSTYLVTGTSMNPELYAGDLIIIKKQDNYTVGDVVTFKNSSGDIVTHKIIDTKDKKYQTKGVNNNFIDGDYITNNNIYGKVVFKIKGIGKYISKFIKYEDILLIIGIVFIGSLVIFSIWRRNVR